MMTERQAQCLEAIEALISEREGIAPTVREIARRMKSKSVGSTKSLIDGLVERGLIRRLPCKARAIEVIRKKNRIAAFVFDDDIKELRPFKGRN